MHPMVYAIGDLSIPYDAFFSNFLGCQQFRTPRTYRYKITSPNSASPSINVFAMHEKKMLQPGECHPSAIVCDGDPFRCVVESDAVLRAWSRVDIL